MTHKGKAVDAIRGKVSGGWKVVRLSDITSFNELPDNGKDIMINGEYYIAESLEFCDFNTELRKVVDNG